MRHFFERLYYFLRGHRYWRQRKDGTWKIAHIRHGWGLPEEIAAKKLGLKVEKMDTIPLDKKKINW